MEFLNENDPSQGRPEDFFISNKCIKCDQCDKMYKTEKGLKTHVRE